MNGIILIILLIVCGLVIEECIERAYMKTEKYKSSLCGTAAFVHVPEKIEICNVGSGPGLYGISYERCRKKGFNFSTAPQNYQYAFRLLRNFQTNIERNAIIIIIIMCPLSFGENRDEKRKGYSDKFYDILPPSEIDKYSKIRALWLKHPFLKKVIAGLKRIIKREEKLTPDHLRIITIWKEEFGLRDLMDERQAEAHIEGFKKNMQILGEGVAYCYEQKWRPVFVIPPIPEETRKYISAEFLQAFIYEHLNIIRNKYKDVPLLDYYSDKRFADGTFQDDIFLNANGKQKFSMILFNDLQEIFKENIF